MILLTALLALQAPPAGAVDLDKAQSLYDSARYDAALRQLAGGCETSTDPVACERLLAFIQVALGEAFEARAAFDRMLAHDPNAVLGPDVSPKLQAMFADAQRAMVDIQALRLPKLETGGDGGVLLELQHPAGANIETLVAHIAPGERLTFEAVPLTREGEVWSALASIGDVDSVRYYLEVGLGAGAAVAVGSAADPLTFEISGGTPAKPPTSDGGGVHHDDRRDEQGLPAWAPWAIGGGVAAVVAAAVIVGVVVGTQSPEPGTVNVTIVFQE